MSSYANHQALAGLTLGKSTDYRDTYDASLLQGVPRSLNRDPLGLKADNLPFHGTDIWTLYELSWLNAKGLPQVAVGHVELLSSISTVLTRRVLITGMRCARRWSAT